MSFARHFGGFSGDFAGLFDGLMFGVFDGLANFLAERRNGGRFGSRDLGADFVTHFFCVGFLKFLLLSEESGFLILEDRDGGSDLGVDRGRSSGVARMQGDCAGCCEHSKYQNLFHCFHKILTTDVRIACGVPIMKTLKWQGLMIGGRREVPDIWVFTSKYVAV